MRTLTFVLAACATATTILAQNDRDSTLLAKGDTARAHGDCKTAVKTYSDLIERKSFAVQAYAGRAACGKDLDEAMSDLFESIKLDPTYYPARVIRSDFYQRVKMYDRAIEDLNVAVEHAGDTLELTNALCERGWSYSSIRKFQEAERDFRSVLAIDSNDHRATNDLGLVMEELGRYDEAERLLLRMVAMAPEVEEGYGNMAFFLSKHERHAEAILWFDKAEAHGAEHPFFYNNRGYSKLKTGDTRGALKDIERSLELDPINSYAYRNRALVHIELKDDHKACTDLETALKYKFTEQFGPEVKQLYDQHCH